MRQASGTRVDGFDRGVAGEFRLLFLRYRLDHQQRRALLVIEHGYARFDAGDVRYIALADDTGYARRRDAGGDASAHDAGVDDED